jgi:hemolysin activation/secretion protein
MQTLPANPATELRPRQDDNCSACAAPAAPGAPSPSGSTAAFRVNSIRLSGVQTLDAALLDPLTAPYTGRDVSLSELETLAQQISALYRERGYFLAQALVPVQTVQGGIVEISVVEGRLGKITINLAPSAPATEERIRAFLAPLATGQALKGSDYERAMLLLSDQPGLSVKSQLQEGSETGTTDLIVEVTAATRWAFSIDGDNQGTRETGRYRLGGGARWASPFGIGDNLDARVMASNDGGLAFGRLSYEAPLSANGLRAGLGYSHVTYNIGGEFRDLNAHGTADIIDLSLNYPIIRSRQQNLFLRLGADTKTLKNHYDAVSYDPNKHVTGLSLGWAWELRDTLLGGGYWASSGTWYRGHLSIRDTLSQEADRSPTGGHSEGGFDKASLQVSRLQRIINNHALYLSLGGQWASKNLDASEKLALGGARAVRAYASSEALVDQGLLATAEWRWSLTETLTPYLFYDTARGWLAKDRLPGVSAADNRQNLRGAGIGLQWAKPGDYSINATLAWRSGTSHALSDSSHGEPRLFVQLQKVFR